MATESVRKRQFQLLGEAVKRQNSAVYRAAASKKILPTTIVKWMRDPVFADLIRKLHVAGLLNKSKQDEVVDDESAKSAEVQQQQRRAPEPQPEPLRDLTEEEIAALPYLPEIPIPE